MVRKIGKIDMEKKYKIVRYKKIGSWTISKTSFTTKKRTNATWFCAIKERKWYG